MNATDIVLPGAMAFQLKGLWLSMAYPTLVSPPAPSSPPKPAPAPSSRSSPATRFSPKIPDTGELAYKVVLQRTVRRLGAMRKITIGDESITVTLGHPFWVVGKGWQMAKEVEMGQRVRCLDSSCRIDAIEELPEDVAYNLVVDDFATYFAGNARLLLHDNTLPEPTSAVLPGYCGRLQVEQAPHTPSCAACEGGFWHRDCRSNARNFCLRLPLTLL